MPKNVSQTIQDVTIKIPKGLTNYYNRTDWPIAWHCSSDLSEGFNYGSNMRWNAAIVEMDRHYKTPVLYRNMGIEMFCNFIEDSIKEATFLQPIYGDETKTNPLTVPNLELENIRTIFPFFILKNGEALSDAQGQKTLHPIKL